MVTLSLYAYFFSALLGRQFVKNSEGTGKYEDPDMYFPFFTTLQVIGTNDIICAQLAVLPRKAYT